MNTLPKLSVGYLPAKVIVDERGFGVPGRKAKYEWNTEPDVIFFRSDGWTLGAPKRFEHVAYEMWSDEWTHFVRRPFRRWIEIRKYGGP